MRRAPAALLMAACACSADAGGSPGAGGALPDAGTAERGARIILVAGDPSHGPREHEYNAGMILLAGLLAQSASVAPMVVRGGWPEDQGIFDGARAIVFFADGAAGHPLLLPGRLDRLAPEVARGVGLGSIHWAVHFPGTPDPRVLAWWGGYYSDEISVNPIWSARFDAFPDHPVARGAHRFELRDEWYYNLAFHSEAARLTPILSAVPPDSTRFTADAALHPGRAETTAWVFEREGGGRSFGFTGAHYHDNWGEESFRRVVVNAILWVAGLEVPAGGAPVALDPAALDLHLDPK